MKRVLLFSLLLTALSGCEEEEKLGAKLRIKKIVNVSSPSTTSFYYTVDSKIEKIIKSNYNAVVTYVFVYEAEKLSKMSRTIKNVENPIAGPIVESNDSIYFAYESSGLLAEVLVRSVGENEIVERMEYIYGTDGSILEIKINNYRYEYTHTRRLDFTKGNVTTLDNIPVTYDNKRNPIYELGLGYKDFYWGDFKFGHYFSVNNVIQQEGLKFLIDYNLYRYPTKIRAVSHDRVIDEQIITYY